MFANSALKIQPYSMQQATDNTAISTKAPCKTNNNKLEICFEHSFKDYMAPRSWNHIVVHPVGLQTVFSAVINQGCFPKA